MDYFEFLRERRKRIAKVVEKGFERLRSGVTQETKPSDETALPTVSDLLRHMETNRVEFKKSARVALENDVPEKVIKRGYRQDRCRIPELGRRDAGRRDHR